MVDDDKYPYYMGFSFAMGFRAKRASQMIDQRLSEHKKIDMEFMQRVQTDNHDLASHELISNILKQKYDLAAIIEKHEIALPSQWIQDSLNHVIPKEIRSGRDANVEYYNDQSNREKAKYAWSVLSEWNNEYDVKSLGAPIFDAFVHVLLRRLIFAGLYRRIL